MERKMPEGFEIYVVRPGDTVDRIAKQFGVNVNSIIEDNQIVFPYALAIGQALFIDLGTRSPFRNLRVSGYAYPFISEWVLRQTLPYLSELPVFSYGFTTEGELVPPMIPEAWMITMAKDFGTLPILTLTPFDTNGKFSNVLISRVINNTSSTQTLINNLLLIMGDKGYEGIDIDFEYILKLLYFSCRVKVLPLRLSSSILD